MQLYGPKELAASLRTVRENTIKIAEDIPEERYGYRHAGEPLGRATGTGWVRDRCHFRGH